MNTLYCIKQNNKESYKNVEVKTKVIYIRKIAYVQEEVTEKNPIFRTDFIIMKLLSL